MTPSIPDRANSTLAALELLILVLLLALDTPSARANVYATNIKLNDGLTNVSASAGASVSISYILNEAASAGVTLRVLSGDTAVRTISLGAGTNGTLRGTNAVVWDGNGDNSSPVAAGVYAITITAVSQGYSVWTQTTDDNAEGNVVFQGRGIAVDKNTNSPYYGRIFIANSQAQDPGPFNWLGFKVGIVKCNSDGSYADEGGFSDGGYPWAGDTLSPWHLEVSADDFVYVNDWTTNGQVIRWDPTMSTNSQLRVLRPDNWQGMNVSLSGPAISGSGTNTALWMADATISGGDVAGLGVLRYSIGADGACTTNDPGVTAVAVGGSLIGNPVDVALDAAGNIYTIEYRSNPGDSNNRVFRFPPYAASTNNGAPLTVAEWAVGEGDDTMGGARGIAVDPTGTYVAVAFSGLSAGATAANGCTQIFYATNGSLVTNIDLGVTISGFSDHEDQDCAWDAVGNVYYIDNFYGAWRAVSPPGTNQATTFALQTIQVIGSGPAVPPLITKISVVGSQIIIDFNAGTNDAASAFSVVGAPDVTGTYVPVTGAAIVSIGPGEFRATFTAGSTVQYFRISRQGTTPPPSQLAFTGITATGQAVVLSFTGGTSDSPSAFTLLSAPAVDGSYFPVGNATIIQVSPGTFQASVPISSPAQFYRIKK